ncbi:hypothetical protein V1279_003097 [Bradyrhizobium sp. AZCC 1610]|uniref:hypothetical protein n=1 Tax=Bradyrhizobium sp. AZCC 1610 TaxID=3117020 RepID=UPI002FEF7AFE
MREFRPLYEYPTNHLIEHLQAQGYVIRHSSEARTVVQFHRITPFPKGVDFKQEALERIKRQISLEHILFEERNSGMITRPDEIIHSAFLRILR